jgi:diaminopimelate epimerase
MVLKDVAREITAVAQGGEQQVVWLANDAEMMLTGPAEIICVGEVEFE